MNVGMGAYVNSFVCLCVFVCVCVCVCLCVRVRVCDDMNAYVTGKKEWKQSIQVKNVLKRSMFGWLSSWKINEPHSSFVRGARINRNINQSMLIKGY